MKAQPGKPLDLKSVQAPNRAAAAAYYPGIYWYAMMKIPPANLFPGTGPQGNGMSPTLKDQGQWLRFTKTDGCGHCHQLGDLATRTIPQEIGHFNTSAEAWERRLQSGQAGRNMMEELGKFDVQRQLAFLGDWTDRVAKGELPKTDPPRPDRHGTQHGPDGMGLGDAHHVPARHDFDGQAQPDVEPARPDLWRAGSELRLHPVARSGRQQVGFDQIGISRSEDADDQDRSHPGALALLGQ